MLLLYAVLEFVGCQAKVSMKANGDPRDFYLCHEESLASYQDSKGGTITIPSRGRCTIINPSISV